MGRLPGFVRLAVVALVAAALLAACAENQPRSTPARSTRASASSVLPCPRRALPLPNYALAPAAEAGVAAAEHQRRSRHVVINSAERAPTGPRGDGVKKYCGRTAWKRTVEVDMTLTGAPGASIGEIVVFVSRFPLGYRTWYVAH
jgi:hypothetical protein